MKISVIMPVVDWPIGSGQPHPELGRALDSIVAAGHSHFECFMGCDGYVPKIKDMVEAREDPRLVFRVFPFRGRWGNPIRNDLLPLATGDLISFMDHDDVYFPGALAGVARLAADNPGRPLIFRMQGDRILWRRQGEILPGEIGGHMIVVPNIPECLGRWGDVYAGDFVFIAETLDRFKGRGIDPVWSEQFIAHLRPWEKSRIARQVKRC